MKKAILAILIIFIASCATLPKPKSISDYVVDVRNNNPDNNIVVSVIDIYWITYLFDPGLGGLVIRINNNTSGIIRISWEKSSVNYAGNSGGVFLDGMKYIDSGKAPPVTVIAPNSSVAKTVFSSLQPYFYSSSWQMKPMKTPVQILLCIEAEGKEFYYDIRLLEK